MEDDISNRKIKCALIIPTRDRPEYLKRILNYYGQHGYTIIVGDSSTDEHKEENKTIISEMNNMKVMHIKFPSEINFYFKVAGCLDYVKEKYCALCADDDFITPNAIRMSVDFLDGNPDFTCAQGNYIGYYIKKKHKNEYRFYWKPIFLYHSNISQKSEERLAHHFANYVATLYAVHRTEILKLGFSEDMKYTDDFNFGELLPSMLTLIYGKMMKLDVICNVREINPNSTGGTCNTMRDFIDNGTYTEKYSKFRTCLAHHLINNSKLNMDEAKVVIDKGMEEYLKMCNSSSSMPRKIGLFLERMPLPQVIDNGVRRVYQKTFHKKGFEVWRDTPPSPGDFSTSSQDLEEFNRIKDIVISTRGRKNGKGKNSR